VPLRSASEVELEGLRIGFYTDDGFFAAAPSLRRAVREAATALRELGAEVEELGPPDVAEAYRIYLGLFGADGGANMWRLLGEGKRDPRVRPIELGAHMPRPLQRALPHAMRAAGQRRLALLASAGRRSVDEYWGLLQERRRYRADFMAKLDRERLDAILCPPYPTPALTHGSSANLGPSGGYTTLFNFLGMPAGVVAATRVRHGEESDRRARLDITDRTARAVEAGSAGLPVGVQVAGRHWREDVVLAVMATLERHFEGRPDYPRSPPV
jgi:fatty acid amide hydrolase